MFINGLCNKERMILRCLAVETKVIKGKFSKLMSYIVFSFTLKGKIFLVRLPDACRKFSLGSKKNRVSFAISENITFFDKTPSLSVVSFHFEAPFCYPSRQVLFGFQFTSRLIIFYKFQCYFGQGNVQTKV